MRAFIVAVALAVVLYSVPAFGQTSSNACTAEYRYLRVYEDCGELPLGVVFSKDRKWSEDCTELEKQIERICVNGDLTMLVTYPPRGPRRTIPYRPQQRPVFRPPHQPQRPVFRPSHQPQRPVFQPPPRAPQHASHRPAVQKQRPNGRPYNGYKNGRNLLPPPERRG